MKKILLLSLLVLSVFYTYAQSGKQFWLAPPDVTYAHKPPGGVPIYLNVSTFGQAATVTIDMPANLSFTPIVVSMAANATHQEDLSSFVNTLETRPTNTVLNTGLRITSTETITTYYEISNTNNNDIYALKGKNALGTEFYVPLHNYSKFYNHTFPSPNPAFASFEIVATEDSTSVSIYSPVAVDGHAARTSFTIVLDKGQTYSCGYTGTGYENPSNHPGGAVILSDKDIAVSIKDDSDHNPSGSCYDLLGDQIVPVNIVGTEYIAVKGHLNNNGDESVFILATQNNTKVYIDSSMTPITTLFAGQTYRYDMDYLASSIKSNSVYIRLTKPAYATHVTGFGCEMGQAILPPLNCAGSQQIAFNRSTNEGFFLNILVRSKAVNGFTMTGAGTATINTTKFVDVPGTYGEWKAAQLEFNTTEIPIKTAQLITNSIDVFSLAIINGGPSTGCRYGFFSEFAAEIVIDAGSNSSLCANDTFQLSGSVSGGTTTGMWTTSGSGQFLPSETDLNAEYVPSPADISAGSVMLTLISTGNCTPVSDDFKLNITPAPTIDAGIDQSVCANNATVSLKGIVTIASGGIWSGGNGTYNPSNTKLITQYTPDAAEVAAGSYTLTLTSTGNGTCNPVKDIITITITPAPTVDAGQPQSLCANNSTATLGGSIVGASGGAWSGGAGYFTPNVNAMNATYTPTSSEISLGSVVLTLTTVGYGNCNVVTDSVKLSFTPAPTVLAGSDQTLCGNNPIATLNGSKTIAAGVQWSGGTGLFKPNSTTLNATYQPTAIELATGSVELILTTTKNGKCNAVSDTIKINYTPTPTTNAGRDTTVCASSPTVSLLGKITVATGGIWVGGNGTFTSVRSSLVNSYTPSSTEIAAGNITLGLRTTGFGNCNVVTDSIKITIQPLPIVNAGANQTSCANKSTVNLAGIISNATGGTWSGGLGKYSTNTQDLNAVYTPSAAEINAGTATLVLTSRGNAYCSAITDTMIVTINPTPIANAGVDQSVCSNNANVSMVGAVNGASGGQWTGGLGIFKPSANALNAVYSPTATEIANGSVKLILTTTGNGYCKAVKDTMKISFTVSPTVDAGVNDTVCANNLTATLTGSITLATGAVWSNGGGTYSPSNTALNLTYTPSSAEILAGQVKLYLTTTGNGNCNSEKDSVIVLIQPTPLVNAGVDQSTCVTNLSVTLSGSVSGTTNSGQWSTSGSGYFVPNNTALNATYVASSADSVNGGANLILTSSKNGSCKAVTDTMEISILPAGTANAGVNQTVCGNNANVSLLGSVGGGATSGIWTTTGTGTFSPNNTFLSATYIPSANDISQGTVSLILTANSCDHDSDKVVITITPSPVVDAGNDQIICSNNLTASLSGLVSGASTKGKWTTTGSGTFSPNDSALNATYLPSKADSIAQNVKLILNAIGIGNCNPVSDTITIDILPTGTVNAGSDQILCANNAAVSLNGVISGGASKGIWTTTGTGTFVPSNTALNATYMPSNNDTIIGGVQLKLTVTNSCNPAADSLNISFSPAPTADAGAASAAICGTNPSLALTGKITGALGGQWASTGSGTFSPNKSDLNATYNASAADINSGSVILYLQSTGNGKCLAVTDSIFVNIGNGIVVDAGSNQNVCSTAGYTQLIGNISNGTTTGRWKTLGSGTFSPNDSLLTSEYNFSNADTLNGSVLLVLTSTHNGSCAAATDTIRINFGDAVSVNAGQNQSTCAVNPDVILNGFVTGGATKGVWKSTGTGTFVPSDSLLNAKYIPSGADITRGNVNLILKSTDNGSCKQGIDTMQLKFEAEPIVNAGKNIEICVFSDSIPLSGNVTNAKGGKWTTNGTGSFVPSDTILGAYYKPSISDLAAGNISIYLTSRGNFVCSPVEDSIEIKLVTPLIVDFSFGSSCIGQLMHFSDSTIVNNGTITLWEWDFNDGKTSNSKDPIHVFNTSGTHDVKLTVTSSLGCSSSIIKTVFINKAPKAGFDIRPDSAVIGVSVSFLDVSSGANAWTWDFGDGFGNSIDQSPNYSYDIKGMYRVKQIVSNSFGCTDTLIKSIFITEKMGIEVETEMPPLLPTGFSPNGDNENDVLRVLGGPFISVELRIYNNWGNLIFSSNSQENGWDGSWKGKQQPAGDYVYTLRIVTQEGQIIVKNGSVSLIR